MAGRIEKTVRPDAEGIQVTDPIEVSSAISQACQASTLSTIEAREAPQLVEGQGA